MTWVVVNSGPYDFRPSIGSPGAPELLRLTVNKASAGDDTFTLEFSRNIEAPVLDALAGFTAGTGAIEIRKSGGAYSTLDFTGASKVITNNEMQVTLAGARTKMSRGHEFRVSYDAAQGDLRNPTGSTAVATFSNNTTFTNLSTINVLSDMEELGDGWYDFSEASGTTRQADSGTVAYNLGDISTVGVQTGPNGTTNAADFTGSNYLIQSTGSIYTVPADGKFTICVYNWRDVAPSVVSNGDSHLVNKWSTSNTRSWSILSPETGTNTDMIVAQGQNSADQTFRQEYKNEGTLTLATWYAIFAVYDPDDSNPIKGYIQPNNTPASFTIEGSNYVAPASGDPQCKSVAGAQSLQVGRLASSASALGTDGRIGFLCKWDRALTENECRAIAEGFAFPPFFPTTV